MTSAPRLRLPSAHVSLGLLTLILSIVAAGGCAKQAKNSAVADAATPESAYRELMMAILVADEATIRQLVVDPDGATSLWESAYPKEVATLMAEQYRTMDITRTENSEANRVGLNSSAVPFALTALQVDGRWKIDVAPLLKVGQAFQSPVQQEPATSP